jgi:putative transposase
VSTSTRRDYISPALLCRIISYPRFMSSRFPRRPPRLPAIFPHLRPLFFVTFNTHQRYPLLASEPFHHAWLDFALHAPAHGAWPGRYVIMPDHVHLFVALADDTRLSVWMQSLKSVLGKTLLGHGHAKPHWQEGFFDHLLRHDESYAAKWEYVRQNPVRKGLCARPEDWPYQGEVFPLKFE